MDREMVAQAVADAGRLPSRRAEKSSKSLSLATQDLAERTRLFTKALTLYATAGSQDPKALIVALIDSTLDLPALWISHALARLCRQPDRIFAPTLGEIRGCALRLVREARWATRPGGRPAFPEGEPTLHEERELAWARDNRPQLGPGLVPLQLQSREEKLAEPRKLSPVPASGKSE